MLRNYNYMITIVTYPFLMALTYLKFANNLKGAFYKYIIIFMLIIFIPSFIMSLYTASEEILNSKKKWRIILLVLFSIFYLPIYYVLNVTKTEKYLGYLLLIMSIPLTVLAYNSTYKKVSMEMAKLFKEYVVINENYVQFSSNYLFSINVDKTFRCNNNDIGDYVISCERLEDDSFIGIYSYDISYDDETDILEKLDFHVEQTIDYIKESGYSYEIIDNGQDDIAQIDYNDNSILITQKNYEIGASKYSLIILKEVPKKLINYEEYQKMIDSIYFLTYNDGVSS